MNCEIYSRDNIECTEWRNGIATTTPRTIGSSFAIVICWRFQIVIYTEISTIYLYKYAVRDKVEEKSIG